MQTAQFSQIKQIFKQGANGGISAQNRNCDLRGICKGSQCSYMPKVRGAKKEPFFDVSERAKSDKLSNEINKKIRADKARNEITN